MTQFSTSTWMQHTFVNLCEKCLKTAHKTEAHHLTIKPQTFVHQWSLLQVLITEGFQICFCNASSNVCRSEHIFVNTHNYPQITHICDAFEADFSPYASRSPTIKGDSWGFLGYHSPSALYPPWSYSTGIPSMCLCIYLSRQTASSWDWADDGHCSYMYRNWWVSDLIHRNKLSCTVGLFKSTWNPNESELVAENFLLLLKSIHPPQSNTVFVLLFDNNLYFNIKLPSTDSYLMHSLSI